MAGKKGSKAILKKGSSGVEPFNSWNCPICEKAAVNPKMCPSCGGNVCSRHMKRRQAMDGHMPVVDSICQMCLGDQEEDEVF